MKLFYEAIKTYKPRGKSICRFQVAGQLEPDSSLVQGDSSVLTSALDLKSYE